VAGEWYGEDEAATRARVDHAAERLDVALATAAAEGSTPVEVAERQALERIEAARNEIHAAA
jgi:hypothetical protein